MTDLTGESYIRHRMETRFAEIEGQLINPAFVSLIDGQNVHLAAGHLLIFANTTPQEVRRRILDAAADPESHEGLTDTNRHDDGMNRPEGADE